MCVKLIAIKTSGHVLRYMKSSFYGQDGSNIRFNKFRVVTEIPTVCIVVS